MYLLGEQSAYAETLIRRLQGVPQQLLQGLEPCGAALVFEQNEDLSHVLADNQLYVIKTGVVHTLVDQRPLFYLKEGDLIGLRQGLDLPRWHHKHEDPISLIPYDRRAVFKHIYSCEERQELYNLYILGQSTLAVDALARLKQPDIHPSTGFQHFAPGEELIRQGEIAEHVFIIIEGHAEAWVDGQKVGDVSKDEIFGAMAVFTQESRTATVIATEPCTVMVIPKDQFLSLMQSNPRIANSLIESMARRIDLMNKEITMLRAQAETAPA